MPTTQPWGRRPWILSLFMGIASFAFYLFIPEKVLLNDHPQVQLALGMFIAVASLSFALSLEQERVFWVAGFAIVWGALLAFIAYASFSSSNGYSDNYFPIFSGLISVCIALPIFQTIHQRQSLSLPYSDLHKYAWNDVLCGCVSWVFVGITFILAYLLAALFDLIGIEILHDLLKEEWFVWITIGLSFGAALGVLKENAKIIDSLQGLVMAVLSILTPLLGISLVVFLMALPFTGLELFWKTTKATTPILLSCAIGAIALVNAIVRNSTEQESKNKLMRRSAIALSMCILPLACIALISVLQRTEQYGLTPQRLWGLVAVLVTLAYGIAYPLAFIISRNDWAQGIRTNNIRMALAACATMLFLALPFVSFNKISVNSQLSRIDQGITAKDDIDFAAFAFDFGQPGRDALEVMQKSADQTVASKAKLALLSKNKWELKRDIKQADSSLVLSKKLVIYPKQVELPEALQTALNKQSPCAGAYCALIWEAGKTSAKLITSNCNSSYRSDLDQTTIDSGYQYCAPTVTDLALRKGKWSVKYGNYVTAEKVTPEQERQDRKAISQALNEGKIEIRNVQRKQLFIDGKPVGATFDDSF